jgi:hypothetical protein
MQLFVPTLSRKISEAVLRLCSTTRGIIYITSPRNESARVKFDISKIKELQHGAGRETLFHPPPWNGRSWENFLLQRGTNGFLLFSKSFGFPLEKKAD